ncbi:hypothetical protein GCM10023174_24450 [Chelativorans composti]
MAAIERHELQRVDHVVVGNADDAARHLVVVDAELLAEGAENGGEKLVHGSGGMELLRAV